MKKFKFIISLAIGRTLILFRYNTNTGQIDDKMMYSISPRLKSFSDWLLKVMASGNLEAIFPAATREYAPFIEELWRDAGFQATYNRRNELDMLPRHATYFLERVRSLSIVLVCWIFHYSYLVQLQYISFVFGSIESWLFISFASWLSSDLELHPLFHRYVIIVNVHMTCTVI